MQVKSVISWKSALLPKLFMQGLMLTLILVCVQIVLEDTKASFMNFMSPLGFFFLMMTTYLVQPILIGAINIVIINVLYNTKGWQVNYWINGVMLLFAFEALNVLLQINLDLPFLPVVALIDIAVFSLPFGLLARYSNGGWKKPID
jgi:hypothetical protein